MTGLLVLGGFALTAWWVVVGSVAAARWTSHRASIRSEESESEQQARMRKLLGLDGDRDEDDRYWRSD
jgi:hypothetical protein